MKFLIVLVFALIVMRHVASERKTKLRGRLSKQVRQLEQRVLRDHEDIYNSIERLNETLYGYCNRDNEFESMAEGFSTSNGNENRTSEQSYAVGSSLDSLKLAVQTERMLMQDNFDAVQKLSENRMHTMEDRLNDLADSQNQYVSNVNDQLDDINVTLTGKLEGKQQKLVDEFKEFRIEISTMFESFKRDLQKQYVELASTAGPITAVTKQSIYKTNLDLTKQVQSSVSDFRKNVEERLQAIENTGIVKQAMFATRVCGDSWVYSRGMCYILMEAPLAFEKAREKCRSMDSSLININTELENMFIATSVLGYSYNIDSAIINEEYTLGFRGYGHTWRTLFNKLYYTNWFDESETLYSSNLCMEIRTHDGKWALIPCADGKPFICEKQVSDLRD